MKINRFSFLFFCMFPVLLAAQDDYNHTELEWHTLETAHFFVNFHTGAERTAHEIAFIAESIYKPVTDMYHHIPDQKVEFIVRDHDDYSNGGAIFFENRIEIWASSLDFDLRGSHPWLWNVITHEFTHIIQIQSSLKFGRKIPAFYLQYLGYEAERRPDVLYGYPNVVISYPISGFLVPAWFAEGTAQYNNPALKYDYWDTHRDMILRMYMLEGKQLSWEDMGMFEKTGLGSESVYNSGFSLVDYIGRKYGTEKLEDISRHLGDVMRLTMDGAIEAALHKTGKELYEEWKQDKKRIYQSTADSLKGKLVDGRIIEPDGFENVSPAFSPDGKTIAYVSNKDQDYASLSALYLYDLKTGVSKLLVPGVHSPVSFSPDGTYLYYAKITRNNRHWSAYGDLYRYTIARDKEERLTQSLRALDPKLSPDGKRIVFTSSKDGTMNLNVCDPEGKNIRVLTRNTNGEQVYTPAWSPDGKKIAFGYSLQHNQSVALIDSDGSNFRLLVSNADARNPFFSPDGYSLYFSWDRTGIFNIYARSLSSDSCRQVTNVLGGAFFPNVDSAHNLAYATYTSSGYKLALLSDSAAYKKNIPIDAPVSNTFGDSLDDVQRDFHSTVQDTVKPYHSKFTSVMLMPLLRIDTYNEHNSGIDVLKPGIFFSSEEVLDKILIYGGAAVNRLMEADLFLVFEYHDRLPIFYQLGLEPTATAELYNITRKTNFGFDWWTDINRHYQATIAYNLFEFDLSLRQPIIDPSIQLKLQYSMSSYSQDFGSWLWQDGVPSHAYIVPGIRSTYLNSNILSIQLSHNGILPMVDRDINPVGRTISLKYSRELNNYDPTDSTDYSNGFRKPIYTPVPINRFEFNWNEHLQLPFKNQTLSLGLRTGFIIGPTVDDFFDFYEGGLIGMQGYPFYAIGGNETAVLNMTYRLPLIRNIDMRLGPVYFSKLYGSLFADIGDAWNSDIPGISDWKKDAGFELRLESFSCYEYPTLIFFSVAYGFDRFTKNVEDPTFTVITYGKEWRFYFGILFSFELNEITKSMKLY